MSIKQHAQKLASLLSDEAPLFMAILNVTPDSFSDGGKLDSLQAVLDVAGDQLSAGAHLLDVGGESTRPGAEAVPVDEELKRTIPAIEAIIKAFPQALISIDTRKASVAKAATDAGAVIINDVSGLQYDPAMAQVAAETGAYLVIMHSQGTPQTMQHNPTYTNVTAEVADFFGRQMALAQAAGVDRSKIILDPGFGFGKTIEHNLTLLGELAQFQRFERPILVGLSRKSFLTKGQAIPPQKRDALSASAMAIALGHGAHILRIHDLHKLDKHRL